MVVRRRVTRQLLHLANAATRPRPSPSPVPQFQSLRHGWSNSSPRGSTWTSRPAFGASRAGFGASRGFAAAAATATPLPSAPFPWYGRYVAYSILFGGSAILTYYYYPHPNLGPRVHQQLPSPNDDEHTVTNWSGTHSATTRVYVQPESLQELQAVVRVAHERGQEIRPVGSGLSPNGIGLNEAGMVNLALMDQLVSVDRETKRVRVQAGARVAEVVEALRPHGLTLQNYASIREQQIGGFIQVGAHGTGARLPPVDEQVVSLKLVTPGKGTLDLSPTDGDLFYLARCGLGALGVVAEVELQCVEAHKLLETTTVTNMKQVKRNHKKWLQENQHLRYMWIPNTDTVVVVRCNPVKENEVPKEVSPKYSVDERLAATRSFYKQAAGHHLQKPDGSPESHEAESGTVGVLSDEELDSLSFTELRDKLLGFDPLNQAHVIKVNQVEADYWKKSEGTRVGWSDEILGFDCGGQQWVSETCFPVGTIQKPDMQDLKFMEQVMSMIKREGIPAPSPIEQRWTASSRSPLSPAFASNLDRIFSWVGIIMYLPTADEKQREVITERFFEYRKSTQHQLWDTYGAHEHWAKMEVPKDENALEWVRERIRQRYPVDKFLKAREELDPKGILVNDAMCKLFLPRTRTETIPS